MQVILLLFSLRGTPPTTAKAAKEATALDAASERCKAAIADLEVKRIEIEDRERAVSEAEAVVTSGATDLEARRAAASDREAALDIRQQELDTREEALNEREAKLRAALGV